MVRNAMSDTPSITRAGLGARTVRPLSKSGRISTLLLCLHERWVLAPDILRSMIAGAVGIGKKFLDSVSSHLIERSFGVLILVRRVITQDKPCEGS